MATATSHELHERLSNIVECSICRGIYDDPRQLPCIHSFCLKCLSECCKGKNPGNAVTCPLCRNIFTIPVRGVAGLPKNFFLEQLKELAGSSSASIHCDKHQNKVLEVFCNNCRTVICVTCFFQSHNEHECSEITEVANEFRRLMTGGMKNMRDTVTKCREVGEGEKKKKVKFNKKVKRMKREICDRADKLKLMIDQEKSNLLSELESLHVEKNKHIDNLVEEIENHVVLVESLMAYTEQLRDKGSDADVTQQMGTIQDRADELMKQDAIPGAINVDVEFTAATWPLSNGELIGKINTKPVAGKTSWKRHFNVIPGISSPIRASQQVLPQQTTAVSNAVSHVISSDGRREVAGVAIYIDKLFVLRAESKERIERFDVKTFQEEEFIKVDGLRDDGYSWCKSMTSCDINSYLYITDLYKVFRVNPTTKDVISWPVDGNPIGLSVNGIGNVLVTCHLDDTIKEYSTRGSFVRSIELQVNHVKYPYHCIQLTDSRYVVCHRSPVRGVSEIDKHGTLIATYRNSETTKLKMNWPRCVILFNDSLLVADTNNDRILLLNTSLRDARLLSLPVDSQLRRPRCMYLEQSRGRLFVGEESGRVLVIDNIDLK